MKISGSYFHLIFFEDKNVGKTNIKKCNPKWLKTYMKKGADLKKVLVGELSLLVGMMQIIYHEVKVDV